MTDRGGRSTRLAATAVALALAVHPAALAGGWVIQSTPSSPGATNLVFGVSCASTSACTLVGSAAGGTTTRALAARWDGGRWVLQHPLNVPGAVATGFFAVSCASLTTCTAVGSSAVASGADSLLAEGWNGKTCTIERTVNPAGSINMRLRAVSCSSPTACTAVGDYVVGNTEHALAERLSGGAWTIESVPLPAGAKGGLLFGVSCPSATACTAVGYFTDSAGTSVTHASISNGTSWRVEATPNPTHQVFSVLSAVSCYSTTTCTAVGSTLGATGPQLPLAERWSGGRGSIQPTPAPKGSSEDQLQGVSCPSAASCLAVGSSGDASGSAMTLVEAWNGKAWTIQQTPNTPSITNTLNGNSCVPKAPCVAAGYYLPGYTLVERN